MRICIIVTFLVVCSTLHLTQAAGRKKIKSWSTSTTLAADSTTSTTTTSTSTTTTTTTSRPITTRSSEKLSYPKKVQSLKKRPTKSSTSGGNQLSTKLTQKKRKPTDVTEKFKDLPADDLAFIKELDKQFKLHGDKIKIKVENDNTTSSGKGKNSKRTIEGELGYGYNHNGYNYDPPKFMFYPYSQSDITPDAPGYTPPRAEVEIQPSYSYELPPQSYSVPNEQPQIDLPQVHSGEELSHHHQQQQQQQVPQYDPQQQHQQSEEKYSEPVIVLRIPGPAKYASHLQALLQQYLEIRAAQYLRLLEEAELRKQQEEQQQQQQQHHQQQQYEQQQHDYEQQQQQQHYGHQQLTYNSQPAEDDSAQYAPEVTYAHQVAPTPAPVNYPAIDDVYQGYKARKQHAQHYSQPEPEPQAPQQSYYTPEQGYAQAPEEEQQQYYYPQQQQQHQPAEQQYEQEPETGGSPHDPAYQQHVYLISMQPQPGYYSAEQTDEEPQQPVYEHEHPGPSNENNPRDTHTKVVYSPHAPDAAADYNTMYQLPSIRPYERHAPTSMPAYHQQYHQQQQQAESLDYQRVQAAAPETQQEPINITQRPYNYHAHGLRGRTRGRKRGTAVNTATTGDTEQRLDKIREYVRDKLGAEMGSAVEIKSTHVINRQA